MPNIAFQHPDYVDCLGKWHLIRHCAKGEKAIKDQGKNYLPDPDESKSRYEIEGQTKRSPRYEAYIKRASFFNVTGRTLSGLAGMVFRKDFTLELPSELEFLKDDVNGGGLSFEQQAKSAVSENIALGRGGLLSDMSVSDRPLSVADVNSRKYRPNILLYTAESIINWREITVGGETFLSIVVLQESAMVDKDGFEFKTEERWRVLRMVEAEGIGLIYEVSIWQRNKGKSADNPEEYIIAEGGGPFYPVDYSGARLNRIPFCFFGSENNDPMVDEPPLYDIASLNVGHYRNSADVEEMAFLTGQPTLVIAGLEQGWVDQNLKGGVFLGSRGGILLNQGANAQLLQAGANNILREMMVEKEDRMKALGAKLIEPGQVQRTATEAQIEESSETSMLTSIAKNVAAAYRKAVYYAARFLGDYSMEGIEFEFSTEFDVSGMSPQERQQLLAEWQSELITFEEAREQLRKRGVAYEDDEDARSIIEGQSGSRAALAPEREA